MIHWFTTKVKDILFPLNILDNLLKPNKLILSYIYHNKELIATHEIDKKLFNYTKEHYSECLKMTMPDKNDDEIEKLTQKNLQNFDKLLNNKN